MYRLFKTILILFFITKTYQVRLKIAGAAEVGPKWSHQYKIIDTKRQISSGIIRNGEYNEDQVNTGRRDNNEDVELKMVDSESYHSDTDDSVEGDDRVTAMILDEATPQEYSSVKKAHVDDSKAAKSIRTRHRLEKDKTTLNKDSESDMSAQSTDFENTSHKEKDSDNHRERNNTNQKNVIIEEILNSIHNFINLNPIQVMHQQSQRNLDKINKIKLKEKFIDHEALQISNEEDKRNANELVYKRSQKTHNINPATHIADYIFNKTLVAISSAKDEASDNRSIRKQITKIQKAYENEFNEHYKEFKDRKIITRLGTQRALLDTINVSNRIMEKLLDKLLAQIQNKGSLRSEINIANKLKEGIKTVSENAKEYICQDFGVCRSEGGFPEFIVDLITILLKSNDVKFRQAYDSFTETLKNTNFNTILHSTASDATKKVISKAETLDTLYLRSKFLIAKNTIQHRNNAFVKNIYDQALNYNKKINSTVAFLEVIDQIDESLPANENNRLKWNTIKNDVLKWSKDEPVDIQSTTEDLISHIKEGLDTMTGAKRKRFSENIMLFFKHPLSEMFLGSLGSYS